MLQILKITGINVTINFYKNVKRRWERNNNPGNARNRLKPRTININGHEVPEPMRVASAFGTKYYVPYLQVACENPFDELTWYAEDGDRFRLNLGICHTTREAAEAHAKALLSFTTTEAA